jgi:hypothetical protein
MASASRQVPSSPCRTLARAAALVAALVGPAAAAQPVARQAPVARAEAAAPAARAAVPTPRVRVVERTPGRVVYAVEVAWPTPLVEAQRRAGGDADLLAVEAVGGWTTTSALVELPVAVPPAVEVLAADAEEAPLARGSAAAAAFAGPAAEVVAVGYERGRAAGTLALRLLQADPEAGVVRRYRRLVVAVRVPEAAPLAVAAGGGSPHVGVGRSALTDGRWFKIPFAREGVYRIDRAYVQALGLDAATTDPARLQVYGNGGRPLPALTSAPRPVDLVENATLVVGGGDGRFDEGDAVYFFAEGPYGWNWDAVASRWTHFLNPFTPTTAYFLRADAPSPRRVEPAAFPDWADAVRVDVLEGRVFEEVERNTVVFTGGGSGLWWLGAELSGGRPSTVALDTVVSDLTTGAARIAARVVARSLGTPATIALGSGGAQLLLTPPVIGQDATSAGARVATGTFTRDVAETGGGTPLRVDAQLQGGNSGSFGWPDWVEVVYPQAPRATGGVLRFVTPGALTGRFEVALQGFGAQPEVWDVTDPAAIRRLGVQQDGGRWLVRVERPEGERPREVLAFEPGAAGVAAPAPAAPVANQNLHGTATAADYVVVTPAAFRAAAEELAEYRRAHDGLEPLVVNVEEIFNEFSGGALDMRAVRDYFKFLFDRAQARGEEPLSYGLLFGDGHHDFRGITPEGRLNNWVPVYETDESFDPLRSYTSDDYFALLSDNEGVWVYPGDNTASFERVDIGVGRIPARTAEEAAAVVRKLRHYESAASLGAWRTRVTLVADDNHPGNEGALFLAQAELVGETSREAAPVVDLEKVYLLSYEPVTTAQGRRVPEAEAAGLRSIEEGTLIWNYIGHGGPEALADERILEIPDIEAMDNLDRLAIFVTATCSFGRFDLEAFQSGAELLVLNPDGGAVAALTTVRLVYAGSEGGGNLGLNLRLMDHMLTDTTEAGERVPRRLGDAYRLTKATNVGAQGNNRKFSLLGDPAMRVGLPVERPVRIDRVNGVDLSTGAPAEFRALERATIAGRVLGPDGQVDPTFDGEVDLVVYDAPRTVEVDVPTGQSNSIGTYEVRSALLYRGRASVRGGAFSAEFIVPQDVSYSGEPARILAYARRAGATQEGAGTTEAVTVSTTAGAPLDDHAGPRVRLFLNDSTFVSGGLTGPDPVLVVRLEDESGINAVGSGVGHELLLVVDGDEATARDVGRFYEGDLDNSRAGTVRVPLDDLAPGAHTLRLTAWDVANNVATAELSFVVSGTDELALRNVFNYPNPTPGPTRFTFEHNQAAGTPARVRLRVYTLAGRPVLTLDGDAALPGGVLPGGLVQIPWDGRDEDLDALATGVYLWHLRVEVERPDGGTDVTERVERLAVIR